MLENNERMFEACKQFIQAHATVESTLFLNDIVFKDMGKCTNIIGVFQVAIIRGSLCYENSLKWLHFLTAVAPQLFTAKFGDIINCKEALEIITSVYDISLESLCEFVPEDSLDISGMAI